MSPPNVGNRVRIADREMTVADLKTGLFYDYFRRLIGTVERLYDDKTVCVRVDLESLPEDARKRHIEVQDAVRRRWMNGLGQETRERLTEAEKSVTLSYNILVGTADLEVIVKGKSQPRPKPEPPPEPAAQAVPKPATPAAEKKTRPRAEPHRPTQTDIEKAEEEHLKSVARRQKSK